MKKLLSFINLATPKSRVSVWALLTVIIYLVPFSWLAHLSLYGHLGWHSAPSIGLTRSYRYVLHGQISNAWHMNRLIFVVLAIGLPLLILDFTVLMRQRAKAQAV